MEGDLITARGIRIPATALGWRFSRGTGPGGQSVNTTDSRVELLADLTALDASVGVAERVRATLGDAVRIVVATERSQLRNREIALQRLSERIDTAATPVTPRRATRPSRSSVANRLDTKRERSQTKAQRRPPGADEG